MILAWFWNFGPNRRTTRLKEWILLTVIVGRPCGSKSLANLKWPTRPCSKRILCWQTYGHYHLFFQAWWVNISIIKTVIYPCSVFQYGFVFGIAQLATVLCTPFVSKYGYLVGPKFVLLLGGIPQGICTLAFGFLTFIQDSTTFLVLSYFLRYIQNCNKICR